MKPTILFSIVCLTFTLFAGCKKEPVGTEANPLKMFFVPSEDTEGVMLSAEVIAKFLESYVSKEVYGKEKGFYIKAAIPSSYVAVVEAVGTGRADFAAINTFGYVLLKNKKQYPGEAILKTIRGKNETSYKAQIIARADSGIQTLEDLNGKKFAYTDPASTAGYVMPSQLFKAKGITVGEEVFAHRHDNVVTMVYQGQVDAGATYYSPPGSDGVPRDARGKVKTQFPDVFEKVKIVDFTDSVPNAPWILRTNIFGEDTEKYEKVKKAIQEGMVAFSATEEGKEVFKNLYSITGLALSSDKDFVELLEMFKKIEGEESH
tara:strand:+ start:19244 stop:20197 length:954 start_codon:yes stop_codon:yes gene_type:complete